MIWMRTAFSDFPSRCLIFSELDCPAALVEIGDLVRCGVQIVRQDTQDLARFGANRDLAHGFAERVLTVSGLACRKKTDAIRQDAAVVSSVAPKRSLMHYGQWRVRFEAGDDTASGLVHLRHQPKS